MSYEHEQVVEQEAPPQVVRWRSVLCGLNFSISLHSRRFAISSSVVRLSAVAFKISTPVLTVN